MIILDLRLKDGTGIDLLKWLRGRKEGMPKVIVLTSFTMPFYKEQCESLGAVRFLDKAKEFDQLPDAVRQLHGEPQ